MRTIILLLDSLGIGACDDAHHYFNVSPEGEKVPDSGANTLGHIAQHCALGKANKGRHGLLKLPHLNKLGLGRVCEASSGYFPEGLERSVQPIASYGFAKEISTGKDTSSGHWEITGVPVLFDWGYFSQRENSFPEALLNELVERADLPGYLGNCHASGTAILTQLGDEHIKTGKPIFYTSADSVFQIACHEETFGLERLYQLCEIARELVDQYNIGRVIARPFLGDNSLNYQRTPNRHDYSVVPPAPTLLDTMKSSGGQVISIGKISDIFATQGITQAIKANGLEGLFDASLDTLKSAADNTIIFTNFVNFDADFGHRRNVSGYAAGLEYFDSRLPEILSEMKDDDLLVITADHGCDPTWLGTDHTREHIPVIFYGKKIAATSLGLRESFADIGQSIASFHGLAPLGAGTSFL